MRRPSTFSPAIQAMLDSCNTTGLPNRNNFLNPADSTTFVTTVSLFFCGFIIDFLLIIFGRNCFAW
jgi:hypothetical protein